MWFKRLFMAVFIIIALILSLWAPKSGSLLHEALLCPVCSGQTVFESNHPIAIQINHLIDIWQKDGLTSKQIIEQLQSQYGDNIMALEIVLAKVFSYILLFIAGLRYAYQKKH